MTIAPDEEQGARLRILLVAPNLSRQMGGEALKALQVHLALRAIGFCVEQVTHARVRGEIARDFPDLDVTYIPDGSVQRWLHRHRLGTLLSFLNVWQLHRAAQRIVDQRAPALVHFTAPISPMLPYFRLRGAATVIGPLNGNIAYPPAFADREPRSKRWTRRLLRPLQAVLGLFPGKRAAVLLVSGGKRTEIALQMGGCLPRCMVTVLDSGIASELLAQPRLTHKGRNTRFVFLGRLVAYKGCDLAIRALGASSTSATLDIIGDGPERNALKRLAFDCGVAERVRFLGWLTAGDSVYDALIHYRALVLPTLAEANGIVVQEAMALGLPVVAVDWGGPAELLRPDLGILVKPRSVEETITGLTRAIDELADNAVLADALAARARKVAGARFDWRDVVVEWSRGYLMAAELLAVKDRLAELLSRCGRG